MKNILFILILGSCLLASGCNKGQSQGSASILAPSDFSEKIKQTPEAPIVDVRTPEEYAEGHIANAKNINWNGTDFEAQINQLDKSKPVYVYCQKGVRSAEAATKMRSIGFKDVYELKGGLSNWETAKLPLTTNTTPH
ncbi:MAG: rhodanese-like domain-containing protein [Saprospiraceae bacterium]|uniref:Rhodanese-like domain-containing protein n=1 Tax=Candidatus Opimibacter skivensis TaxID=2982028 RepID=A0A9D7SSE9_9BACT|nr:rhodanese-like domain-containing protein [Candidatus Opimibacter skivensis]